MTNDLYEKLAELQWLLHRQQIRSWAENGPMADTSRGQGRILALLKLRDGISTKDLSYLLGVRVSSLNELLSKLEKGGYIIREPSEQDKRVMLVKLTEKGKNEQQPVSVDCGDIFSCLSEDEQKTMGEYLGRIIDALHAGAGNDDEDKLAKLEDFRSRFGDIGAFFGGHGHDFPGGHGFPRGWRMRLGPGRFRRGGFPEFRGFGGHGRNEDD
ncbi:MAG: MarR family transcriptional regulator [Oscillospiraceae bacterium]|jgi:DNA-binding MarR family transcriptional regulator|nr:MarR family transcriptional regulator [Oscillospiraceae bacterium]